MFRSLEIPDRVEKLDRVLKQTLFKTKLCELALHVLHSHASGLDLGAARRGLKAGKGCKGQVAFWTFVIIIVENTSGGWVNRALDPTNPRKV